MSGLAVAAIALLGAVFAWRLLDVIGLPSWSDRGSGAVAVGVSRVITWVSRTVPRTAGTAIVALGLIGLGGLALLVGALLPLGQMSFFTYLPNNSLLAHGGWALIGLAVIAAVIGYRSYRTGFPRWSPSLLGLTALAVVVWMATDSGLRTGYDEFGFPPYARIVFPLAVGPYVAGAGAILVTIGGWLLRHTSGSSDRRSLLTVLRARKAASRETSGQQLGQSRPV